MKSIFKPNTLEECVKSDEVSATLYKWADIINGIGICAAIIIILSGIITSADSRYSFIGGSLFFIGSLISALVVYGGCLAEHFLLKALASIVESNCIQARAALYMAFSNKVNESEIPEELRF